MRLKARVDTNQSEIVAALRGIGATVQTLHQVGKGCPDLLVGFRGINHLLEVKDGKKRKSEKKLTSDEEKWHSEWKGKVCIVESVEEALDAMCVGAIHVGGSYLDPKGTDIS